MLDSDHGTLEAARHLLETGLAELEELARGDDATLTPEGEGPASIFWMLHVYQALGVPAPLASALWPLTMTSMPSTALPD